MASWLPSALRSSWVDHCNRQERLAIGSESDARVCEWANSSYLTAAKCYPALGARFCRHCLGLFPIRFRPKIDGSALSSMPAISIVIPFAGEARLPLLKRVLESFYGQDCTRFEIILPSPSGCHPPEFVAASPVCRFVEVPMKSPGFCKSALFNQGVRIARSSLVLLHDADILVPMNYVSKTVAVLKADWEAVQPIRFLFYLERNDTARVLDADSRPMPSSVEDVRQNFAGGSLALRKPAYEAIGGHDEDFVGWGGEDVEFAERLRPLKLFRGSFMPALHLWHPACRELAGNFNMELLHEKSKLPARERSLILQNLYQLNSPHTDSLERPKAMLGLPLKTSAV